MPSDPIFQQENITNFKYQDYDLCYSPKIICYCRAELDGIKSLLYHSAYSHFSFPALLLITGHNSQ